MKLKQILKITLLIVILVEESRSVKGKNDKNSIKASDIAKNQNGLNEYKYI